MNVLSLFSGIGGLELGLERAGMTVVGQVEIDPFCRAVLAKHWPEVPRHDDVRTAVEWWLGRARPPVDVVCGGFPCQPISNAGRRRGQDDERWLWPALADVIRSLRPRYVVMENVAALLGRGLGVVLGDLAACGYDAEWDCLPAAAVGAPHLRDRWFAVAYPRAQAGGWVGSGRRQQLPKGGPLAWTAADADPAGLQGRGRLGDATPRCEGQAAGGHDPAGRGPGVVDTDELRRDERPWAFQYGRGKPTDRGWWATEPDVGRVAHGIPPALDGGLLVVNAHKGCFEEARAAGSPKANRVRIVWGYDQAAAASPRPSGCVLCGGALPDLSQEPRGGTGDVGRRPEEGQDVHRLWEALYALQPHAGKDLLAGVPVGSREGQRIKALGSRADRLRALGNAVVPQVAEYVGRLVMAAGEVLEETKP